MAALETKPPKRSKLLWVVLGLWAAVILGAAVIFALDKLGLLSLSDMTQPQVFEAGEAPQVGQPAPLFEVAGLDGKMVSLAGYKGRVVVLNFWATWCGPCVREMPMFQKAASQYASEMVVLGIDMQESANKVRSFMADLDIQYDILIDQSGQVGKAYQVFMLPTTYFIGADGLIQAHHIGIMTEDQLAIYLSQAGVGVK